FNVTNGSKHVGNVDGVGNTTVNVGTTLSAAHFRQNSLTVNGTDAVRAAANPTNTGQSNAGVSKLNSLTIGAAGKLNLTNQKLIVVGGAAGSTFSGGVYHGIAGMVATGYNGGLQNGNGIITD